MFASVLVDYDNVCRTVMPERGPKDVALNLDELVNAIAFQVPSVVPDVEELQIRLYGGWIDRSGRLTARARWLESELPAFRRRVNRLRVRPSVALALALLPDRELVATYRSDTAEGQKMVDGMITVDAVYLAVHEEQTVLIVSDDDDFVPALIGAHCLASRRAKMVLMRRNKARGTAPNDGLLDTLPLTMTVC